MAAHGYDDFTLSEDCFTEEPETIVTMAAVPPPPPPPGMPPMPPGFVPPPGSVPNFPPPPPDVLIPQPAAPKAELAVASSVGDGGMVGSSESIKKPITLEMMPAANGGETKAESKKKVNNNNKLVFSGEEVDEAGVELSMEEVRMRVPRYWNMISRLLEEKRQV